NVHVASCSVRSGSGIVRKQIRGIALITGLVLVGCSSPPKQNNFPGRDGSRDLDPAPPAPAPLETAGGPALRGLLAGQVLDKFDRKVPKASIQLIEVREGGQPAAPVELWANDQGYFTIPGLDPSAAYQLVARVKDGEHLMAGTLYARP